MSSHKPAFDAQTIRQLYASAPENLPLVIVHRNLQWRDGKGQIAPPRSDCNSNVHMAVADFEAIQPELPFEYIGREADVLKFKIALEAHHLQGGTNDARAAARNRAERHGGMREALGFNAIDGSPKRPEDPIKFTTAKKPKSPIRGLH
jgi:hypothetical protein